MEVWWNCECKIAGQIALTQTFYANSEKEAIKKMQNWIWGCKNLWIQADCITATRSGADE